MRPYNLIQQYVRSDLGLSGHRRAEMQQLIGGVRRTLAKWVLACESRLIKERAKGFFLLDNHLELQFE